MIIIPAERYPVKGKIPFFIRFPRFVIPLFPFLPFDTVFPR